MRFLATSSVFLLAFCVLSSGSGIAGEKLPAFPGAEGYGAASKGGRGGKVIKVTNLKPGGPGSFQWACDQTGPTIIVFEVSGVVACTRNSKGKIYLSIKEDTTIAGQTAPGAGITIEGMISIRRGGGKGPDNGNRTLRFLRGRAILASGNLRAVDTSGKENMILDHVSASWAPDDTFDLYGTKVTTYQWCGIEESDIQYEGGDEPHNFAITAGGGRNTIHHSLVAHHHDRAPMGQWLKAPMDWRNNVIYNVGTGGMVTPGNMVGNYSKAGPGGGLVGSPRIYQQPTVFARPYLKPNPKAGKDMVYMKGNYMAWGGGYFDGPWSKRDLRKPGALRATPLDTPPVTTHTAEEAYELVMAHAGCLPRDAVSARINREVQTSTGAWGRNTPNGGLMEGLTPGKPPKDSDNDGMPDEWEKLHKLDPAAADNNKIVPAGASPGDRHKGYTYIEYYINELADTLVAQALTEYRLRTEPAKPWDKPATGLSPFAMKHKTVADMVKAIGAQDATKGGGTADGWYACQQLSRMGDKGAPAVPGLIKFLEAKDPRSVYFAAWGLGAIGPAAKDAVPALIKVLGRDDFAPKGGKRWKPFYPKSTTAWALGRIGPAAKDAVPALASLIKGRKNFSARGPGVWALGQIGPAAKSAIPQLVDCLGYLGHPLGAPHQQMVAGVLAGLGKDAVPALTAKLKGGKAPARAGAALALGKIGKDAASAAPGLVALLADSDPLARSEAAMALARVAPGAASGIAGLLSDTNYAVRHKAAKALGICGGAAASAIPALEKVLKDKHREVKRAAALAMGGIGQAALPALKKAVTGTDAYVRKFAARGLSGAGAGAVPVLTKALSDKNAEVRREAVWSLARIGKDAKSAIGELEKARKDSDYVVRYAAGDALKRIK